MEEDLTLYCCSDIVPTTLSLVLKGCQNRFYAQSRVERLSLCDLILVWTVFQRLTDCSERASAPTARLPDVCRRFSTFGDHRRRAYSQQHRRSVGRPDTNGKGINGPHCMAIIVATVIHTCVRRECTILSNSLVVLLLEAVGIRHDTQGSCRENFQGRFG